MAAKKGSFPDLKSDAVKCVNFLQQFISNYADNTKPYIEQLQAIADRRTNILNIRVDDLRQVSNAHSKHKSKQPRLVPCSCAPLCLLCAQYGDVDLLSSVMGNTQRYVNLFYAAADSLMPQSTEAFDSNNMNPNDAYQQHR